MGPYIKRVYALITSATAKDTSVVFLGNAISSGLGIVFTILAARYLGPEKWGVAAVIISFIAILVAYGELGLTSGLFKFVSRLWAKGKKLRAKTVKQTIFSMRILSAFFFLLIVVLLSPSISSLIFKVDEPMLAILGAVGLFGFLMIDFQIASMQSRGGWKTSSFFIALTNFFRLVFIFILLAKDKLGLLNVLGVYFGSSVVSFLLSLFWERSHLRLEKDWKEIFRKIVGFSSWMGLNRIVGSTTSRLDVLLLLQLSTALETGILAAARQLANGIPIIVGSFATVIAPRLASYEGPDLKSFYRKTILLSMIIAVGVILGVFIAEPVMSLFGPKYRDSISVFRWLLVALLPFVLSTPAVNVLIYSFGKPKIIALLSVFQLPLVFFGNIFFIPRLGVFGPVLVLGLWNLSTLFVTYSFAWHYFRKQK